MGHQYFDQYFFKLQILLLYVLTLVNYSININIATNI